MASHSICVLFSIVAFCLLSCNNKVKPKPDPVQKYAIKKYENDFTTDYNSTKEYVILSKPYKIKDSDPFPTLRFEVLEVRTMEVVFNDNLRGGKAAWIRDYILEAEALKDIPGPEGQSPKDNTYLYHVKNRKKFTSKFFK